MKNLSELRQRSAEAIEKISEEVLVRDYSIQAIGRKRNVFLNSLAQPEQQFQSWVVNRLYRIAYDNGKNISDFTPQEILAGLNKWETILRQKDPQFSRYAAQFKQYKDKFMSVAQSVLADSRAEQGQDDTQDDSQAQFGNQQQEPDSDVPTGFPRQDASKPFHASVTSPGVEPGDEEQSAPTELEVLLQQMQDALELDSSGFMDHVEDMLLNSGQDPTTISQKKIGEMLDAEFQDAIDNTPGDFNVKDLNPNPEDIFDAYKKRFLSASAKMLKVVANHKIASTLAQEKDFSEIEGDDFAKAVAYQLISEIGGQDNHSAGLTNSFADKVENNQELNSTSRRFVANLLSTNDLLHQSVVYYVGNDRDKSEFAELWTGLDGRGPADICFDFGKKRARIKNGALARCSQESLQCYRRIGASLMVGPRSWNIDNKREADATWTVVMRTMATQDYPLDNQLALEHRLVADGMDGTVAAETAAQIVQQMADAKERFVELISSAQGNPDFKNQLLQYTNELTAVLQSVLSSLPSIATETIQALATGKWRFRNDSERIANVFLVGDHNGDNAYFLPINHEICTDIANEAKIKFTLVSLASSKVDPVIQHYLELGMDEDEAERIMALEYPYRLRDVAALVEPHTKPTPPILSQFETQMQALMQAPLPKSDNELAYSQEEQEYLAMAPVHAFESVVNLVRFLEITAIGITSGSFDLHTMYFAEQESDLQGALATRMKVNNQVGDTLIAKNAAGDDSQQSD